MAVAHRGHLETELPLLVALSEELLHDSFGPLPVEFQRFGRIAEIGAMDYAVQQLNETTETVQGRDRGDFQYSVISRTVRERESSVADQTFKLLKYRASFCKRNASVNVEFYEPRYTF